MPSGIEQHVEVQHDQLILCHGTADKHYSCANTESLLMLDSSQICVKLQRSPPMYKLRTVSRPTLKLAVPVPEYLKGHIVGSE